MNFPTERGTQNLLHGLGAKRLDEETRRWYVTYFINEIDHWYMMVVSLVHQTVFQLDTYPRAIYTLTRHATMRKVCETLFHIMSIEKYASSLVFPPFDLVDWEIKEARGVPNLGSSDDSSVWILQWMSMEDSFQPEVLGVLNEINVRVKTAMALLHGPFNKQKRRVEANAARNWNDSTN